MKGTYILVAFLGTNQKIKIGKLGIFEFKKGYYLYVGSAMNSLGSRVMRHLRKRKKLRWHIDYLLKKAKVVKVLLMTSETRLECTVARKIAKSFKNIKGLGASDCDCDSHMFYSTKMPEIDFLLENFSSFHAPEQ